MQKWVPVLSAPNGCKTDISLHQMQSSPQRRLGSIAVLWNVDASLRWHDETKRQPHHI